MENRVRLLKEPHPKSWLGQASKPRKSNQKILKAKRTCFNAKKKKTILHLRCNPPFGTMKAVFRFEKLVVGRAGPKKTEHYVSLKMANLL